MSYRRHTDTDPSTPTPVHQTQTTSTECTSLSASTYSVRNSPNDPLAPDVSTQSNIGPSLNALKFAEHLAHVSYQCATSEADDFKKEYARKYLVAPSPIAMPTAIMQNVRLTLEAWSDAKSKVRECEASEERRKGYKPPVHKKTAIQKQVDAEYIEKAREAQKLKKPVSLEPVSREADIDKRISKAGDAYRDAMDMVTAYKRLYLRGGNGLVPSSLLDAVDKKRTEYMALKQKKRVEIAENQKALLHSECNVALDKVSRAHYTHRLVSLKSTRDRLLETRTPMNAKRHNKRLHELCVEIHHITALLRNDLRTKKEIKKQNHSTAKALLCLTSLLVVAVFVSRLLESFNLGA